MTVKKKKTVSFNTLVKMFMRDYNIPTKKDIDKLMNRIDHLEQLIKDTAEAARHGAGKRKTSGGTGTASDIVIDVIKEYKDGINFAGVKERTGFEEKKLRNIIFRLDKTKKIKRIGRGIYIVNSEQFYEPDLQ